MDKLEELKQKIEQFQAKSAAKGEIQAFIILAVSVLKKYKETFESISSENLSQIKDVVDYLEKQKAEILTNVKGETTKASKNFANSLKEVKELLAEIKAIEVRDGEDGKDADEEKIVEEVLFRIKLPEYKEVVLDGGAEIVSKINELDTDDEDQKIDASHIKNLPKSSGQTIIRGTGPSDVWKTGDGQSGHKLTVSATAPYSPMVNDIWLDIS